MEALVQTIRKSEGVARSREEATEYIDKAVGMLETMPDGIERQGLEEIARYTVSRKS
jgi:geranylgeranyl pyrophosphate synthase